MDPAAEAQLVLVRVQNENADGQARVKRVRANDAAIASYTEAIAMAETLHRGQVPDVLLLRGFLAAAVAERAADEAAQQQGGLLPAGQNQLQLGAIANQAPADGGIPRRGRPRAGAGVEEAVKQKQGNIVFIDADSREFFVLKGDQAVVREFLDTSVMAGRLIAEDRRGGVMKVEGELVGENGEGCGLKLRLILKDAASLKAAISKSQLGAGGGANHIERVKKLPAFQGPLFGAYVGTDPRSQELPMVLCISDFSLLGEIKDAEALMDCHSNLELFLRTLWGEHLKDYWKPVIDFFESMSYRTHPFAFKLIYSQYMIYSFFDQMSRRVTVDEADGGMQKGAVIPLDTLEGQEWLRDRLLNAKKWDSAVFRDDVRDNFPGILGLHPRTFLRQGPKAKDETPPSPGGRISRSAASAAAAAASTAAPAAGGGGSSSGSSGSISGAPVKEEVFCLHHLLEILGWKSAPTKKGYVCTRKCGRTHALPKKPNTVAGLDAAVLAAGWKPLDGAWRTSIEAAIIAKSPWPK